MILAPGWVLIFLSVIPVATIRLLRNRRLSGDRKPAPRGPRMANWFIAAISIVNLLFVAGTTACHGQCPATIVLEATALHT